MEIHLTEQEQAYLQELLDETQKNTIHELNHTDTREFRALLRQRLELLEHLMQKLAAA